MVQARLTDAQVDQLGDALEAITKTASSVTFMNYQCTHDQTRRIGVMRAFDFPRSGLTTALSFGLAHQTWEAANFPDRIELVQTWDNKALENERLLVVAAETIIMTKQLPKPGVIYQSAVQVAGLQALAHKMPDGLVLFPYLWDQLPINLDLLSGRIWLMQVAPIYEDEAKFIEQKGFDKFEELLSYDGADLHKLERPSHIANF